MPVTAPKASRPSVPYPPVLHSLTSLRFFAAAWVLLFHFKEFFPGTTLQSASAARLGYLGVDFFFVLSGFVLALVYMPKIDDSRFDYWSFLVRRVARIYPLHILTLVVTLGLSLIGLQLGWDFTVWNMADWQKRETGEILRALFTHLTLIHAWGSTNGLLFNLPSWSISAEWFAYLLFPVFIIACARLFSRPIALVVFCSVALVALDMANTIATGHSLLKATWNIGALRIIPTFALGIALHRLGQAHSLGPRGSLLAFLIALVVLTGLVAFETSEVMIALCLAAIVFLAADAERNGHLKQLCNPFPVLLGEVSYGVYLWHFPLGILAFDVVLARRGDVGSGTALVLIAAVVAAITAVSWVSYKLFEVPARSAIVSAGNALGTPSHFTPRTPPKDD